MSGDGPPLVEFIRAGVRSPGHADPLLDDLHGELANGASLVLTGPAGNGKSTALALVMGGVRPTSGEVRVLGRRPWSLPPNELDALRAQVGYVPQRGGLLSNLTLADNVSLPLRYHHGSDEATVRIALERVRQLLGIGELPEVPASLAPLRLRRLAALARALVLEPRLLVLDEPARDLAGMAKRELWALIGTLRERIGIAVLAATSDAEAAYALGGRVISLPARQVAHDSTRTVMGVRL
jgi:phospholipid/cholesterol/gamma-HCH transport system ATP-binding protein